ncbi:protein of unknown function [Burkholderia multivorans]
MEIFSVNEKVCFEKQRPQYSELAYFHYSWPAQTSIAETSIIALRRRPSDDGPMTVPRYSRATPGGRAASPACLRHANRR